jgi:monoamine oxidase
VAHVIVIGAGAAGLMTARVLSEKGIRVDVLEVRDRPGGRIFTLPAKEFSGPVDLGAEFVHGDPPIIKSIVKEAGLTLHKGEGRLWHLAGNTVSEGDPFDEDWGDFMHLLNKLEVDLPIGEFLRTRFKDETHASLRESVTRFVQGFDAADAEKVSSFALRDEWATPADALMGYHIEGGYSRLITHLQQACVRNGVSFHFSTRVNRIHWRAGAVRVTTSSGEFQGDVCVSTIPPAVLKTGSIRFTPDITSMMNAIDKIETGGVIKFFFEFNEPVWDSPDRKFRQFPGMHFIFSDANVPTWWSQLPSPMPLLTGWLSGPVTRTITKGDKDLVKDGLQALAYVFETTVDSLLPRLKACRVANWDADPWSLGAYAYRTVGIESVLEFLAQGIADTIYFAGEAFHAGKEIGTVEAALDSGKQAATSISKVLGK